MKIERVYARLKHLNTVAGSHIVACLLFWILFTI